MRSRLMFVALLVAGTTVLGAACGPEDKDADERQKQVEKAKKRAAELKKITKPGNSGPDKPLGTKEQLISRCLEEEDGASCQGACVHEHAESCHRLAMFYETGGGGLPEDLDSARMYQRKSCDYGAGSGCYSLALYYKIGKTIPKNPKKAALYFKKACDLKYQAACDELNAAPEEKKKGKK